MIYKFPKFNNNFMKEANAIRDFFYSSGMVDLLREGYGKFGIYWLDMHSYGSDTIFSTKSIKTIGDFKGKKMFTVPQFGSWLEKMGAAPAEPAGGDLFMNLKLGTLDAIAWDINGITALRYWEAAPYVHIGLTNDQMIGHWEVNMKAWKSLPDDLKQVLKDATKDWWDYKNKAVEKIEREAYKMSEKGDFTLQKMDASSKSQMLKYAKEAWDEWAKHDKASAKAVALQKEWYNNR
jgi:TRAP-type C4-dicarboxylate transport system substrate-binding protein